MIGRTVDQLKQAIEDARRKIFHRDYSGLPVSERTLEAGYCVCGDILRRAPGSGEVQFQCSSCDSLYELDSTGKTMPVSSNSLCSDDSFARDPIAAIGNTLVEAVREVLVAGPDSRLCVLKRF